MHANGSRDRSQAEAAAGRAVGGGPPLSVEGTATASSFPPPPPLVSGAAVQPRARDSSSRPRHRPVDTDDDVDEEENRIAATSDRIDEAVNDPPRSNATRHVGERPSDDEENNLRSLDYLAAPLDGHNTGVVAAAATHIGATLDDMDEEHYPVPPAQIGAGDVAINELIKTPPNIEDAPIRPSQVATDFDSADKAMEVPQIVKQIGATLDLLSEQDAPIPPAQIGAVSERIHATIDELKKTLPNIKDVPMHPSQVVADFDDLNKTMDLLQIVEQEETLQQALDPPAQAAARVPSPPQMDQGRSLSTPRSQQQIPVQPPPQSMMPSPDDGADPPESALPLDPSVHMLEATLVEDQPEIPVYDAIQVAEQTRFERNKKIIVGVGMGLLIGAVIGVSVSSNNGSSDSNTIEPEGVVSSTARPLESSSPSEVPSLKSTTRPLESSSPSDIPSLRPTLRPSQTLAPSTSLRPTVSLRPSLTSRPSSIPTATPPVYCGEINVLADYYYYESSWDLVRIDAIGSTTYTTVVLEGSPKEEGLFTYEACLEAGDYEFAIFDSCGDGILSPGYYSVTFDGVVVAQGGEFGSEETASFSLPLPSLRPSDSESRPPSETPSSSLQPSESSSPITTPSSSLQPSPLRSSPPSTYWSTLNWSRQGLSFKGDASNDLFGRAVAFSSDASTMAIGAPGRLGPGFVKVYRRGGEGSSWKQRGDTIHGEADGDYFGGSLSLSEDGTTLSIGAQRHGAVAPDSGQVIVYEWEEAVLNYVQIGDTLYGAASGDIFGYSLDISNGKILAVGARNSNANGSYSGQVTVYAWDEASSNFKQRGEVIDGGAAEDYFGHSVSLAENGKKLAVSAPGNDSISCEWGQVMVFEWDEATSNYQQSGCSLLVDEAGDYLGLSVSFSHDGTTLAIGNPQNSKNGPLSGQVKVFAWDEAALSFAQIGQSLYGKRTDEFGRSVVLSSEGKTLAIGAPQAVASKPGYVEVYGWDETALEYKRLGQSLGGEASYDWFGYALALAGDGRDLAVGAPFNARNGTGSGQVEVFDIEL